MAGEIRDKSPFDTGDVSNMGYRTSVSTSKSGRTRFGESWTDDSRDPGRLNGSNRATIGDPAGGTAAAAPSDADTATSVSIEINSGGGSTCETPAEKDNPE